MWWRALTTLVAPVRLAALVPTLGVALLAVAPLQAQQCVFCGDVNGDGQVDIVDALFIAQNTVGLRGALACTPQADVRPDQNVDIVDALFIAQFTVGTRPILCFRIDSPAPQSLFASSPIPVTGTLTGEAAVACNSVGAAIGGGSFNVSVPLQEGNTTIACVAQDAAGHVATATESVTLDTTPPRVVIGLPADGSTVSASPVVVTGLVNDIVVGTVNGNQATVSCNGVEGQISNRTFAATGIALAEGSNTITCTGTDRVGNIGGAAITVKLDTSLRARINQVSGDLQSGQIGMPLLNPLVVSLTDAAGNPAAGKPVIFKVVENDGTVDGGGMNGRSVVVTTDANGRSQVQFTLGTRAGAGNNQVQASAVGFDGQVIFCATAATAPAARIVVDSGNNQHGVVAQALPLPFSAIVVDQGNNRLPDVPVTFTVTQGGGSIGGQQAVTVDTDSDGRAQAVLTLGSGAGVENNMVEASFAGNTGAPAGFVASGALPGDPANTSVSGVVLDNSDAPVPGATLIIADTTLSTTSDAQGQFHITGVPVGRVRLFVDGSTVQRPGTWPNLEFSLITVAGQNNTVERGAVYLLPLEIPGSQPGENKVCVDETHGGTITLAEVPGFSLTILPGSATFPNGLRQGCVMATPVHPDKMPKLPNFGQQPRFAVTIQPAGTRFDPPAPITIPNADGLPPGQKTDMYSYDHDLEQFVSIGTGTVSEDGTVVRSDPGVGVIKAGWHCGGNPAGIGTCEHQCDDGDDCTIDSPLGPPNLGGCVHSFVKDGESCRDMVQLMSQNGVNYEVDDSCLGRCDAGGHCMPSPEGFNISAILAAVKDAGSKVDDPCVGQPLHSIMKQCLEMNGFKVVCDPTATVCGNAGPGNGANVLTLTPNALKPECDALPSSTLHEMIHACGFWHRKCRRSNGAVLGEVGCTSEFGEVCRDKPSVSCTKDADCSSGPCVDDCILCIDPETDKSYGCEASCYGDEGSSVGNALACK